MGIKDSKRTKVMPICKLCLQEKELCESHIIPKFIYRPVNDEFVSLGFTHHIEM